MHIERNFLIAVLPEIKFFCFDKKDGVVALSADAQHPLFGQQQSIAIDSRRVHQGDVFFALPGARVDGHDFIGQAFALGASAVVVSRLEGLAHYSVEFENKLILLVSNTVEALIQLAKAWRKQLSAFVVGITGSVGKTSTKEIMRTILQEAHVPAYVSLVSENEILGLCKNILSVRTTDHVVVCEVGINAPGEMAQLVELLQPTLGLITNITYAHSAALGSLVHIAEEKKKLFSTLQEWNVGIVCGDIPLLKQSSYSHPVAFFGFKRSNQVYARRIKFAHDYSREKTTFEMHWFGQKVSISCLAWHHGNIANALAAATLAYFLHIPLSAIVAGIERYSGFTRRFEIKRLKVDAHKILVSDCYNANPISMKASLDGFDRLDLLGTKVAILGDMLELGKREKLLHAQVGRYFSKIKTIQKLILIGPRAYHIGQEAPSALEKIYVSSWQEAKPILEELLAQEPAHLLIKGSLGMRLENLVQAFAEESIA